jgi:SufS family cysteine desulfurase
MAFDPKHFKSQFPLFSQTENQSLIYLDNASTTQKPQCVIDAITHFYLHHNGNAQRASHRLARAATNSVAHTRALAAAFFGANKNGAKNIVFTSGATSGLNLIAHGLTDFCQQGDEILITHEEHHANLLPWQRLSKTQQCTLAFLPIKNGLSCWDQWPSVVNERTRIIAFSAASNVLGHLVNLDVITQIKQQYPRVIVVVDASQLAPHIPLAVEQWQCDFAVCSAHKMYGPTGIGLLYGCTEWLQKMSPLLLGGEMVNTVDLYSSSFVDSVERFEAGTSSLSAIAGLGACLEFLQSQDRAAMHAYEQALTTYLYRQLDALFQEHNGLQLVSHTENNIGIATVVSTSQYSLSDLALWLDEHDIAVRVGDHCAQTLWRSLAPLCGAHKGLRISLAAYNTRHDIDQLIVAMGEFLNDKTVIASTSEKVSKHVTDPFSDMDGYDDLSLLRSDDLLMVTSWQKRFKTLQQWGACITYKPQLRQDDYLVKGCETAVWLKHYQQGEQHYFIIDSDSSVIKGLAALLLVCCNGQTRSMIHSLSIEEKYQQLGLQKHLSPSRMNGFMALLNAIRQSV